MDMFFVEEEYDSYGQLLKVFSNFSDIYSLFLIYNMETLYYSTIHFQGSKQTQKDSKYVDDSNLFIEYMDCFHYKSFLL